MLKRGYDRKMVMGTIMVGGVLGIVIPPSIPMIMMGVLGQVSVGKLYFGGVVPGILCALYT
jgi:TRAP-type C4-dicarboxylate transport system permease large subunit